MFKPKTFLSTDISGAGGAALPATVSQAEAEAGTGTATRLWTPQRVKQAIDALGPSGPGFLGALLDLTSDESIAASSWTEVPWDAEEYDVGGWADLGSQAGRLTVPAGGQWVRVGAQIRWNANTGDAERGVRIRKNGAALVGLPAAMNRNNASVTHSFSAISGPLSCVEGDYFTVEAWQDHSSAVSLDEVDDANWFFIQRWPEHGVEFDGALFDLTANEAVGSGAWTNIPWDAGIYDTRFWVDIAINPTRLTVPAGVEWVQLQGNWNNAVRINGDFQACRFLKGGANAVGNPISSNNDPLTGGAEPKLNIVSPVLRVAATDYFEFQVFQDSGFTVNTNVADDHTWATIHNMSSAGLPFSGCLLDLTSNEAIAASTWTAVPWDAEEYDVGSWADLGSQATRLTVPTGVTRVQLCGNIKHEVQAGGDERGARITKNGATFVGNPREFVEDNTSAGYGAFNMCTPVLTVVAGDYFELEAWQDDSVSRNLNEGDGEHSNWFSIRKVE